MGAGPAGAIPDRKRVTVTVFPKRVTVTVFSPHPKPSPSEASILLDPLPFPHVGALFHLSGPIAYGTGAIWIPAIIIIDASAVAQMAGFHADPIPSYEFSFAAIRAAVSAD